MKMVTSYNSKDMIEFATFVVEQNKLSGDKTVFLKDFENWKLKKAKDQIVRAKFIMQHFPESEDGEVTNIALTAVVVGSEENEAFSKYTPAGSLNLTISNEAEALGMFIEGEEYYVDIKLA